MIDKPLESDWKVFRKYVPEWRERYLKQKNVEISAVLDDSGKTPTDQFWDAKQMMKDEAKILVSCLDGHSRSNMIMSLLLMFRYGLVKEPDLDLFSEELKGHVLNFGNKIGNRDIGT